ncbi:MAG: hypothetical protein RIS47_2279 [Bacteroidota bacterium]
MKPDQKLPERTVERLSQYRRTLLRCEPDKTHIFSHELAELLNITAVQVRRDIMLMGYSGQLRKGYEINQLIEAIGKTIDHSTGKRVAVVGVGKLGRAIIGYFSGQKTKLSIVASFDIDAEIVGKEVSGIPCYHLDDIAEIIAEKQIELAILTVPQKDANNIAERLANAGIKGILNYTSTSLRIDKPVFLEEYDMVTSLEKLAYFSGKL